MDPSNSTYLLKKIVNNVKHCYAMFHFHDYVRASSHLWWESLELVGLFDPPKLDDLIF